VHGLSLSEIGLVIGPVRGAMGILGMIVGGLVADRLGRRDPRWRLITAGVACLLAGPAEIMFLFSADWTLVLFGLILTSLLTTSAAGPVYAACVSVAKPTMRATAMAICLLLAGVAGQVIGPLAVGVLNDALSPSLGDLSVRYSLLVSAAGLTLGGACFAQAAKYLSTDIARATADAYLR
jgi:MFS family permease